MRNNGRIVMATVKGDVHDIGKNIVGAGRDETVRQRLGVLGNAQDAAIAADEDHVERDIGVAHPERDRPVVLEIKQHAATLGQFLAVHQATLPLGIVGRKLDGEGAHAGLGDDFKRRLSRRVRGRDESDSQDGEKQYGGEVRRRPSRQ